MSKLMARAALLALLGMVSTQSVQAECAVSWNQLVDSQAEHESCFRNFGGDTPHFAMTWNPSGGWNGTEGFMRWRVNQTLGEDDDGYWINHPTTGSRSIFLSFVARVGPNWWSSHTADTFKFVMFYPSIGTNPRPTIFNIPIRDSSGRYMYRTFAPDLEAGGQGCDQFGNCNHDQSTAYPNHTYKEDATGHEQWYYIVMSLEGDKTKTYIWSQDGRMSGMYAESLPANSSLLSTWNAQTWRTVRLLAYIKGTIAGDSRAYMDIGRISVSQTLPAPPAGFVTGESPVPSPPTNVVVE